MRGIAETQKLLRYLKKKADKALAANDYEQLIILRRIQRDTRRILRIFIEQNQD